MKMSRRAFAAGGAAAPIAPLLKSRPVRAAESADVVVIGAGLSGLNAAWILTEAGYDVTVLEGASRIGGRVWSATEVETKPELGASQVGPSYARIIDAITRLDLKMIEEDRAILPFTYHLSGQNIRAKEWVDHPLNKTVGDERKLPPVQFAGATLAKLNPMKELEDWLTPGFAKFDVPIAQVFREGGVSQGGMALAELTQDIHNASALGMMQESFRGLYEARFGNASSASFPMRAQNGNAGEKVETAAAVGKWPKNIVGGTWQLIKAMSEKLKRPVQMDKQVVAIQMDGDGADVVTLDGAKIRAKYVISAVPFATLRNIDITPVPDAPHNDAIANLGYAETTRAFGLIKQPFWQQDGLEPSLFTDGPLRMLWVLDNHKGGPGPFRCMFVMTWRAAEQVASLPAEKAPVYLIRELERIRPASKGQVEILKYHSWGRQPLQRGCRHMFKPGQINAFGLDMVKPIERLHIAGEHTRRLDYGMESAMEGGERAAQEVLARL